MKVVKKALSIRESDRYFAMGSLSRHWSKGGCGCC